MTTGCILRDDSITLSQQEYMLASGIYKKRIFFLQMTLASLLRTGGMAPCLFIHKGCQHAIHFCSTGYCVVYVYLQPAIYAGGGSFSLNLES
jgi:hypothetical protein